MNLHTTNELSGTRLSRGRALHTGGQTDRQTEATANITMPKFAGGKNQ